MFSQAAIIRHHYIRALVESKRINTIWISGKENPADMFTKPLLHQPLRAFMDSMQASTSPTSAKSLAAADAAARE
jgi:hypothetical protein